MGGLGNQMFQIFTALGHMFKHDYVLALEEQSVLPNASTTDRTVYWDSMFRTLIPFRRVGTISLPLYHEPAFHFNEIPNNDNIQLHGYFQSPRYFEGEIDKIIALLDITSMRDRLAVTEQGRAVNGTTGIHFRFGDYVKLQEHHPLMTKEYYLDALEYILLKEPETKAVTYFCEDQDLVRVTEIIDHLKQGLGIRQLTFSRCEADEDQDEMLLFSLCKNHILANSTFGWWSAYLAGACSVGSVGSVGSEATQIVCYPSVWFGPAKGPTNTDDLFPDTWIKI